MCEHRCIFCTSVTESLLKILKMALRILKAMALGAQVWEPSDGSAYSFQPMYTMGSNQFQEICVSSRFGSVQSFRAMQVAWMLNCN